MRRDPNVILDIDEIKKHLKDSGCQCRTSILVQCADTA